MRGYSMVYLTDFTFPGERAETAFIWKIERTCYDTFYPFRILSARGLHRLDFEPVTILYGGNGSGKSTALNIIAEKTKIKRDSVYNKSNFYPDYVGMCDMPLINNIPENSRIITSDDVFDYMLNVRNLNEGIDEKREDIFDEYLEKKFYFDRTGKTFQMESMEDYDDLKKIIKARSKTQSKYVRSELVGNVREFSNGESAYIYFTEKITENGFYILDEPENSLSPKRQIELAALIEESARFFGCQFIISTHSPFLLAMRGAKIYDLDNNPASIKKWTELENVRIYRDFFKSHDDKF